MMPKTARLSKDYRDRLDVIRARRALKGLPWKQTKRDLDWMAGFACAAGILAKVQGTSEAKDLLKEANLCMEDFILSEVEPYDLEAIWPNWEKEVAGF